MSESHLDFSLILPIFEEEESLPRLLSEIHTSLQSMNCSYEIICVDDGSSDRSFALLRELAQTDSSLVVVQFRRNFGQTAAMQAGIDHARGKIIGFMDILDRNHKTNQQIKQSPGMKVSLGF